MTHPRQLPLIPAYQLPDHVSPAVSYLTAELQAGTARLEWLQDRGNGRWAWYVCREGETPLMIGDWRLSQLPAQMVPVKEM